MNVYVADDGGLLSNHIGRSTGHHHGKRPLFRSKFLPFALLLVKVETDDQANNDDNQFEEIHLLLRRKTPI
jgi:hypothetical protein